MRHRLALLVLFSIVSSSDFEAPENAFLKKPSVVTTLVSNWNSTSLLAEASEFIATEGHELFESYINIVNRDSVNLSWYPWERLSEKQKYEYTISAATQVLLPESLKFLKFSLALRQFSPRVQFFQKMAEKYTDINCAVFVVVNGKACCDFSECTEMLPDEDHPEKVFATDHVFRETNARSVVVLYGELGATSFSEVFKKLRELNIEGGFKLVVRHYSKAINSAYVSLSGYGVELKLKKSYYGKNESFLEKEHIRNISYPAMLNILKANDTLDTLQKYWENFPNYARYFADQLPMNEASIRFFENITAKMRREMLANRIGLQEIGVSQGECSLYINGIEINTKGFDLFNFIDILKKEEKLIDALYGAGFHSDYKTLLMGLDFSVRKNMKKEYLIDYRQANPYHFITIKNPQDDPKITENLFNVILLMDPSTKTAYETMLHFKTLAYIGFPIKISLVFVVNDDPKASGENDASLAMLFLWKFFRAYTRSSYTVFDVLADSPSHEPTVERIREYIPNIFYLTEENNFKAGSALDQERKRGNELARKLQLTRDEIRRSPKVLLNGLLLNGDGWTENGVVSEFDPNFTDVMKRMKEIGNGLRKKFEEALEKGEVNVAEAETWALGHYKVVPEMNERIWEAANTQDYIDLFGSEFCEKNMMLDDVKKLSNANKTRYLLENMQYVQNKLAAKVMPVSIWVIADAESKEGRRFVHDAFRMTDTSRKTRVGVIFNPFDVQIAMNKRSMSSTILSTWKNMHPEFTRTGIMKWIDRNNFPNFTRVQYNAEPSDVYIEKLENGTYSEEIAIDSYLATELFGIKKGQRMIIANGLKIGPLRDDEHFELESFKFLEIELLSRGAENISNYLEKLKIDTSGGAGSNDVIKISSLVGRYSLRNKRTWDNIRDSNYSVATVPQKDTKRGVIDVLAVVDPISIEGQKLGGLLKVIRDFTNSNIRVVWNPNDTASELPMQKSYYKYAIRQELEFNEDETMKPFNVSFDNVTEKYAFSMILHTPKPWVVELDSAKMVSKEADVNLRHVEMKRINEDIVAAYSLKHLLLKGHCERSYNTKPPIGLHLNLGTNEEPDQSQTTVINDGYFQLKANPGEWKLRVGDVRASSGFWVLKQEETDEVDDKAIRVYIDSYDGGAIDFKVGKEDLSMELDAPIVKSTNFFGFYDEREINVFSIASGHFEERFLKVMIVSVKNNTKLPVKFWFLESLLSLQCKESLPKMAKHYDFKYKLVDYKWPTWMHSENATKKVAQAYKALFIDLLFPSDVERIIFLSPFTLVRADLMDLMNLDLGDSAYGIGSVCGGNASSTDSSLFFVDLPKFRQLGLGERRRQNYQNFFELENHLINPNYNVLDVSIQRDEFISLPEVWLRNEKCCPLLRSDLKIIELSDKISKNPVEMAQKLTDWKRYDFEVRANF